MQPFRYLRPTDPATALAAMAGDGVRALGGGTGLVDLMKLGVERPVTLVDVTALPFGEVTETPEGLRIGALVRNSDLAYHPLVRRSYPVLSEALLAGASPQLRNMATVGGNLMQRTRCSYFRDVGIAACNKRRPGSGCAAMEGFHRMHAVLGASPHCIATHPSDMCVALLALDASVHVQGSAGPRTIPIAELHRLPGDHPELETALAGGEIITHLTLPVTPFSVRSRYVKARDRASYAFALASAAVALDLDGSTIRAARVALGGVATKPWRSQEAERALAGQPATRTSYQRAAEVALADARPLRDNAYKVVLAKRVLVRALETAGASGASE
jgi:xanthine dehydrogenase YagS FAD-binding subunit